MSQPKQKDPFTFTVTYDSGEEIIVKPVSWVHLDDVVYLQQRILELFMEEDGAVGMLFRPSNRTFLSNVEKLASLLKVVGDTANKGIDISQISSIDTLTEIFITTTKQVEGENGWIVPQKMGRGVGYLPSEIARIHSINFYQVIMEANRKVLEAAKTEQTKS